MAKLNKKYKIKGSNGIEELNLYTTKTEAGSKSKAVKIPGVGTAYYALGDVNSPNASKKRVKINGITYAGMKEAIPEKTYEYALVFLAGDHEVTLPKDTVYADAYISSSAPLDYTYDLAVIGDNNKLGGTYLDIRAKDLDTDIYGKTDYTEITSGFAKYMSYGTNGDLYGENDLFKKTIDVGSINISNLDDAFIFESNTIKPNYSTDVMLDYEYSYPSNNMVREGDWRKTNAPINTINYTMLMGEVLDTSGLLNMTHETYANEINNRANKYIGSILAKYNLFAYSATKDNSDIASKILSPGKYLGDYARHRFSSDNLYMEYPDAGSTVRWSSDFPNGDLSFYMTNDPKYKYYGSLNLTFKNTINANNKIIPANINGKTLSKKFTANLLDQNYYRYSETFEFDNTKIPKFYGVISNIYPSMDRITLPLEIVNKNKLKIHVGYGSKFHKYQNDENDGICVLHIKTTTKIRSGGTHTRYITDKVDDELYDVNVISLQSNVTSSDISKIKDVKSKLFTGNIPYGKVITDATKLSNMTKSLVQASAPGVGDDDKYVMLNNSKNYPPGDGRILISQVFDGSSLTVHIQDKKQAVVFDSHRYMKFAVALPRSAITDIPEGKQYNYFKKTNKTSISIVPSRFTVMYVPSEVTNVEVVPLNDSHLYNSFVQYTGSISIDCYFADSLYSANLFYNYKGNKIELKNGCLILANDTFNSCTNIRDLSKVPAAISNNLNNLFTNCIFLERLPISPTYVPKSSKFSKFTLFGKEAFKNCRFIRDDISKFCTIKIANYSNYESMYENSSCSSVNNDIIEDGKNLRANLKRMYANCQLRNASKGRIENFVSLLKNHPNLQISNMFDGAILSYDLAKALQDITFNLSNNPFNETNTFVFTPDGVIPKKAEFIKTATTIRLGKLPVNLEA